MKKQEKESDQIGLPGWLELYDLSLHTDVEAVVPKGAYIRGKVDGRNKFEPTTTILGDLLKQPPETGVTPGWVELSTVIFHSDVEAVVPIPPNVRGGMDEDGHFYPMQPFEIIGGPEGSS